MAKTITITNPDNDKTYKLELNREEVSKLEQRGINPHTIAEMPVTAYWELFNATFNMHCARVSANERKDLYDKVRGEKLSEKLSEMYIESYESLTDENEEGNAMWEASW